MTTAFVAPTLPGGPQAIEATLPAFESNVYLGFNATITGDITATANMLALWTPTKGNKFVLRGIEVLVTCTVTCNDASGTFAHLMLFDNANTAPVAALGMYASAASVAGDVIVARQWFVNTRIYAAPLVLDLGRGFMSRTASNVLYLGGTDGINAGTFRCSGVVWGVEQR